MRAIPAVGGPTAPIVSLVSSLNFLKNGKDLIAEGYRRVSPHGVLSAVGRPDEELY